MQSQLESFRADFSAIATSALHSIKTDIQYFLSDSRSELQGRSAMIRRWLTISPWVIVGVITALIASTMSASRLWMTLLTPPPLFRETFKAMLSDDLETGKRLLRDYVNATVGFEQLAHEMDKDPKTPMRMLSAKANPRANNFLAMVARLKQREGVSFSITPNDRLHVSRFAQPEHFWPSLFADLGFHCANDPQ